MEVTTDSPEDADAIWQGVIDLGVLIETSDQFSEQMFGLSKRFRSDRLLRKYSRFAERGLPEVRSAALANALQHQQELSEIHGPGEVGGYTFASLSEIRTHLPPDVSLENSDWQLVLDLAELLVRSGRHRADQVRFVVWYDW